MKKFMIATGCVTAISLSAVGISQFSASAGGDEASNDEPIQAEEPTVQTENSEGDWFESLPYKEFELDVEYDDDAEYEADYEHEGGDPEAEIEDERDGKEIEISGDKALDELSGILPNMDIDENTDRDELINAALEAFALDPNYDELEIEIEFKNGKEMEIEDD